MLKFDLLWNTYCKITYHLIEYSLVIIIRNALQYFWLLSVNFKNNTMMISINIMDYRSLMFILHLLKNQKNLQSLLTAWPIPERLLKNKWQKCTWRICVGSSGAFFIYMLRKENLWNFYNLYKRLSTLIMFEHWLAYTCY